MQTNPAVPHSRQPSPPAPRCLGDTSFLPEVRPATRPVPAGTDGQAPTGTVGHGLGPSPHTAPARDTQRLRGGTEPRILPWPQHRGQDFQQTPSNHFPLIPKPPLRALLSSILLFSLPVAIRWVWGRVGSSQPRHTARFGHPGILGFGGCPGSLNTSVGLNPQNRVRMDANHPQRPQRPPSCPAALPPSWGGGDSAPAPGGLVLSDFSSLFPLPLIPGEFLD